MSLQRYYPVRAGPSRHSRDESKKEQADDDEILTSTQISSQARVKLADVSFSPINVVTDSPQTLPSTAHSCGSKVTVHAPRENADTFAQGVENNGLDNLNNVNLESDEDCKLANWGLYPDVLEWYKERKIEKMFQWQRDCLKSDGVLAGRSLVFSAPTSAGKTMVADILMFKQAYEKKKKVLLILPYISIIREKMLTLQSMLASTHLKVGGFMGQHHTPGGFDKVDIAICTVEKANNYILRLIREHRLNEIGAIVVDEVHTISDGRRGIILELLLAKVMMFKNKSNSPLQIIAMSATLPNVPCLAAWLDAAVYQTDFRPVELKETIKLDREVHDAREMKVLYKISEKQCPDIRADSVYLAVKCVIERRPVLIFYNNKEKCEKLAVTISSRIKTVGSQESNVGERVRSFIKQTDVSQILDQLNTCVIKADATLIQCVKFGVAFHHGGLCIEHRAIVEEAFRSGLLKVLVATSTLSAGVNLPARVVLVQTPLFGNKMMDPLTYRQMIGRAGRKGIDDQGESILLCNKDEMQLGVQLVKSETPPVHSSISDAASCQPALQKAILEAVSVGLTSNHSEIVQYLDSTFYISSADEKTRQSYRQEVQTALQSLITKNFIITAPHETADGDCRYQASQLGQACIAASIYPQEALRLVDNLKISSLGLVICNDLHLLVLVIPDSLAAHTPFKTVYLQKIVEDWRKDERSRDYIRVAEILKIDYLKVMGSTDDKIIDPKITKFFLAVALNDIIKETPIHDLELKFGISKAVLQTLQNNSAAFASMVSSFCRELGWESFQLLIENLQTRLEFGVKRELINLMRIPCLNAKLARSLYKANFDTVIQVANANTQDILTAICASRVYVTSPNRHAERHDTLWIESQKKSMTYEEVSQLIRLEARQISQDEVQMNWIESGQKTDNPEVFKTPKKRPRSKTRSKARSRLKGSSNLSQMMDEEASASDATVSSSSGSSQELECAYSLSTPKKKFRSKTAGNAKSADEIRTIECRDDVASQDLMSMWTRHKRAAIFFHTRSIRSPRGTIGQNMGAPPAWSTIAEDDLVVDNKIVEAAYFSFGGSDVYVFPDKLSIRMLSTAMNAHLKKSEASHLELIVHDVSSVYLVLRVALNLARPLLTKMNWFDIRIACWLDDPGAEQPSLPNSYITRYLDSIPVPHDSVIGRNSESSVLKLAFTTSLMPLIASKLTCQVLSRGRMGPFFKEVEMIASLVLSECALHGFLVDLEYLQHLNSRLTSLEKCLTSKAHTIAKEKFDLKSPHEIARILYHKLDLLSVACEVIDTNPNRIRKIKESKRLPDHLRTGRKVLEKLSKYHELPLVIHEHRSVFNVLSQTISPLLQVFESRASQRTRKPVLVPKFELFTATGRAAMFKPDLMKTPRTFTVQNESVNVRKIFTALPGFTLISADYSQLELRVLAHLSRDVQLMDVLNSGVDVFRELAARIDSCFVDDVTDERRQQIKAIAYGIIYGMGSRELSGRLGVSEPQAVEIKDSFLKTLSGIKPFVEETLQKLMTNKFIETLGGRRRLLPGISSKDSDERSKTTRQAINSTIQGSAADIAKAAMCKVDKAIEEANIEAHLTLEMHDELIYQVKSESLNRFAQILSRSMQQVTHDLFPDFQVQLPVNLKTGHDWGEMSTLDADAIAKATDS